MTIATQVQKYRKAHHQSLERMAQVLGVSMKTVWLWERARTHPSPMALDKLSRLGIIE